MKVKQIVVSVVCILIFMSLSSFMRQHNPEEQTRNFATNEIDSTIHYPYKFTYEGNPLVRNHSATDPDLHVWNDTLWMYCSQDHQMREGDKGTYDRMDGYHASSTTDMVHWIDHGEVMNSRNISWGLKGWMWALGAAHKNGKYYLYYPHKDKKGEWRIGVGIGNTPAGPFKDIGHPIEGLSGIDPMVFIDDDGQAYIYNNTAVVAKLKPNMIELAEKPHKIKYGPEEVMTNDTLKFLEGSYMHKTDGIYYYSFTNWKNKNHQGFYAMGDNPYGPFEWKGAMAPAQKGAQDHHSIVEFKGKWYYFYHIAGIKFKPENWNGERRIACFDRLFYNEDGTIKMVVESH